MYLFHYKGTTETSLTGTRLDMTFTAIGVITRNVAISTVITRYRTPCINLKKNKKGKKKEKKNK